MPRSACSPSGMSAAEVLGGEGARDEDRLPKRPAQPLEPADQIDGRADGGEIEPIGGADIAPQDLAEMQGGAER